MALFPVPLQAALLEALDVQPGQRVLMIGMGAGENSVRLASLVGDNGQVVSLALDEEMADKEERSLEEQGVQIGRVSPMDALAGYPAKAPYDRILAYGSVRTVPMAWLEQLAPDGVLVANLRGNLASVFLRLTKGKGQTSGRGFFLPVEGQFPIVLDQATAFISPPSWEDADVNLSIREYVVSLDVSVLLNNNAFLFFLQCELPHLHRYWRGFESSNASTVYLFDPDLHSSLSGKTRDGNFVVHISGDDALWEQVERCYYRWRQRGHPRPLDFHFHVRGSKQYILYPATGEVWVWLG